MGRRSKTSLIEDLIELASGLHWGLCIFLAVFSYGVLAKMALQPPTTPVAVLVQVAATAGQYMVPAIFLFGAAVSAWRRHARKELLAQAATTQAVDGMTWRQFERLVAAAFEQQGFQVQETGRGGADGGVDLVLTRGSEKHLVQCKQWRALRVGVDVIRELYGVMAARGAAGGFVVTSGRFTEEAQLFAAGRNVKLIDGTALMGLLSKAPVDAREANATSERSDLMSEVPKCPRCGKTMVRRTARRGAGAGNAFWGCEGFPECRGTRPASE